MNDPASMYKSMKICIRRWYSRKPGALQVAYEIWPIETVSVGGKETYVIDFKLDNFFACRIQSQVRLIPLPLAFWSWIGCWSSIWMYQLARRSEWICVLLHAVKKSLFLGIITWNQVKWCGSAQTGWWNSPGGINFFKMPSTSSTVDVDGSLSE